jgi:hypothetical protein
MYSAQKTIEKGAKETVVVSVAAATIIQLVLENLIGIEVPKDDLVKVAGSIGVVSGIVRGIFNWVKNRKK